MALRKRGKKRLLPRLFPDGGGKKDYCHDYSRTAIANPDGHLRQNILLSQAASTIAGDFA